ncbi:fimbrial protein [Serratia bockelmannii]|uniref:fimbrial protein n=1 Tax=Serratia bockelmannii TaxID=2703793 RepID=UPI0023631565|nr:fimbrial protein [Serratia bockelmannii]
MSKQVRISTLLLAGMLSLNASAKEGEMLFHGILIEPPPCTLSNDNLIEVDFGERVGIKRVDGVNYRQPLNYQISCEDGGGHNWALTLSLTGAAAAFDAAALQTNKDNLGIRVYLNDKSFMPGSAVNIELASPPRLEAVPIKNVGAVLTEGVFEAWATLRADYQ